jgi:pSer/pThr/pTyr-binding forkhead associated (FHA) protein
MPAILHVLRYFDTTHDPGEGTIVTLGDRTTLGRHPESVICLPIPAVSKYHAQIQLRDGAYFLEDRHSRNGTYLNGRQIVPSVPVRLAHRDHIRLGGFEALFLERGPEGEFEHPGEPLAPP